MLIRTLNTKNLVLLLCLIILFSCRDKGCVHPSALNYNGDAYEKGSCSFSTYGLYLSRKDFSEESESGQCDRIDSAFIYFNNRVYDTIVGIHYPTEPVVCVAPGVVTYEMPKDSVEYYAIIKGCFNDNDTTIYVNGLLTAETDKVCKLKSIY